MTDEPLTPEAEEIDALARIASTRDGYLLHRYLRRVLESVRITPDPGTLQRHEGGRTLARDLMGHMAPGIEGRSERTTTDAAVLSSSATRVATGRARGTRRRVSPDPSVAAFIADNSRDTAEPS